MIIKKIVLLLVVIFALAGFSSMPRAQSHQVDEPAYKNLHHLMEEGIHERFTYVSYTIWHDSPLTPEKLATIAESALELRQMAEAIPAYSPGYMKREEAKEQLNLFQAKAAELSKVSQRLAETASKKDKKGTQILFKKLEASCQDCHNTFNKQLRNK
jgi:cytochrome c556